MVTNLFQIIGFSSAFKGPSRSGFSIVLHKDFVAQMLKHNRSEGECVTTIMKDILRETVGKANLMPSPIRFHGDTWLLKSLHVGGNCACFSSNATLLGDRHLRFDSHNLDEPIQAACVLSMWLYWFNNVITLTEFDTPFAM